MSKIDKGQGSPADGLTPQARAAANKRNNAMQHHLSAVDGLIPASESMGQSAEQWFRSRGVTDVPELHDSTVTPFTKSQKRAVYKETHRKTEASNAAYRTSTNHRYNMPGVSDGTDPKAEVKRGSAFGHEIKDVTRFPKKRV